MLLGNIKANGFPLTPLSPPKFKSWVIFYRKVKYHFLYYFSEINQKMVPVLFSAVSDITQSIRNLINKKNDLLHALDLWYSFMVNQSKFPRNIVQKTVSLLSSVIVSQNNLFEYFQGITTNFQLEKIQEIKQITIIRENTNTCHFFQCICI